MALLRGANRPLLTRLVEQEVANEVGEGPRDPDISIDFASPSVIQCGGELALLDEDEVKGFWRRLFYSKFCILGVAYLRSRLESQLICSSYLSPIRCAGCAEMLTGVLEQCMCKLRMSTLLYIND